MKVKMGMFMTDANGKIGGQCLQRNHYGLFARNIVIPTNPQTTPQQDRRAQLAFLTANWQLLTPTEQANWIAETANYPRTNAFGDTYYLTGQALYIALNLNLWRVGEAFITDPVTKVIPPDYPTPILTIDETGGQYTIETPSPVTDADTKFILFATASLSPGRFYVSTQLRSILVFDADGTDPVAFPTEYAAYFGAAIIGKKVFVKIQPIDIRCGCAGVETFADAIVT